MAVLAPRLTRCQSPSGQVTVRLGDPLLDAYLEFLEARCRPNSVLPRSAVFPDASAAG
jgi:hypothetical protein